MKTAVITCVSLLLLAIAASGQTAIYVGGGPSIYSQAKPRTAGNLTWGVCTSDGGTCSLTSVEARGSARDLDSLVYAVDTGIRQRVASTNWEGGRMDLFSLAAVGAAVTGTATGGLAGLGGGLSYHPARAPNWSITVALRGVYSPVNPGWQPWATIHVGYTFRTQ